MIDPSYLQPGRYVESDAPEVVAFAKAAAGDIADPVERAVKLYYAVRDKVLYDPYQTYARLETYSGLTALLRGRGYCVAKAALLAACCRAAGIPARLGFADVRNHLATPRLLEMTSGDVFYWHGYADVWLDGKFVKATPAFNLSMCERFGVLPLEFDGRNDSIFHPYDRDDRQHMEYVRYRGTYAEVPVEEILATFREHCPRYLDEGSFAGGDFGGDTVAQAAR
jgi:transglutaminase-like putative cysteine protease